MQFRPIAVLLETLRFLARRWATLIRLTWVPMALAHVAGIAVGVVSGREYWGNPADAEFAVYLVSDLTAHDLGLIVLQAPLVAMTAVAVHRLVLFNADRPGEVAPFALGPTDGLYMLMGVTLGLVFALIEAVLFVPAYFFFVGQAPSLTTILDGFASPTGIPVVALHIGYLVSCAVFAVVWARILVWPAAVVARESVDWRESWSLTEGKFWRIFALVLIAVAVIWIVYALVWFLFIAMIELWALSPEPVMRGVVTLRNSALFWLSTVFLAALASFAYKALRGYRPDEAMPR